ncbi:low-density lipoprotein receptor-related protein 5-like [Drosophila miranda]|uniref:low-density lipoprotein receptor-related protein 5-like n=1 Tax=Drosophila miranda TaxID=7229 RepID=UPI0007E8365A|nr:low-density lipoprotein receptor-related protein 5-like [Drosophila miranda]
MRIDVIKNPCFHAYPAGEQHCRLGGFLYWLDDKTGVERITVNEERRSAELQRMPQITDISAVWTPDAKVRRNHTCLHSRTKCFHICIASGEGVARSTRDVCSRGAHPACGPDHFTCAAPVTGNGNMNKDLT